MAKKKKNEPAKVIRCTDPGFNPGATTEETTTKPED